MSSTATALVTILLCLSCSDKDGGAGDTTGDTTGVDGGTVATDGGTGDGGTGDGGTGDGGTGDGGTGLGPESCIACHGDQERLLATVAADTGEAHEEPSGEG